MSTDDFITTLPQLGAQPSAGQIYICDTQELFTGWQGQKRKEKLLTCCSILGVDTTGARPHNAGEPILFLISLFCLGLRLHVYSWVGAWTAADWWRLLLAWEQGTTRFLLGLRSRR